MHKASAAQPQHLPTASAPPAEPEASLSALVAAQLGLQGRSEELHLFVLTETQNIAVYKVQRNLLPMIQHSKEGWGWWYLCATKSMEASWRGEL